MIQTKRILANKLSELLSKHLSYDVCVKIADRLLEAIENSGSAIVPQKVAVAEIITDREGMFIKIGEVEIEVGTIIRPGIADVMPLLLADDSPPPRFHSN